MIHGKRHPMIAAITVGDCEMLVLRRVETEGSNPFEIIFHTEMQRIDGHAQSPLQLARVDGRIDPNFTDAVTVEVIERGSAVHCVSAYEGDVVIMGSDGVFDNLFLDEIIHLSNSILQPGMGSPLPQEALAHLSRAIVMASHSKSQRQANGRLPECPIGIGGKVDDTSVVVAEVLEWTEEYKGRSGPQRRRKEQRGLWACGDFECCGGVSEEELDLSNIEPHSPLNTTPQPPNSNVRRR
ncbi:unnamed protein product [Polarella glacialis]|uniref:Protein phosphatase n=1 Tax=Polarella glacialis TaxID=89957 RepID=A0A813JLM5_POLGL|nr:unnamed protein product [Polarella glacialis]